MLPLGRQNKKGKSSRNHGHKSSLLPAISSVGNGGSPGLILPKLENKVCLVGASQEERQRRDKSRRRHDERNTDGAYNNGQHEPRARQRQDDCSGNKRINSNKLLPRRGPDALHYDTQAMLAAAAATLERTARNIGKKKTKKKKMVTTVASNTTITSSMISRAIRTRSESASPVREDLHLSLSSLNVSEKDSSIPVKKIAVGTTKPTIQASVNSEKGSIKAKAGSSATSARNANAKSDQRNGDESVVNHRRSSTESDKPARIYDDITYTRSRNTSAENEVRSSKGGVAAATRTEVSVKSDSRTLHKVKVSTKSESSKISTAQSDSSITNKITESVRQTTSKYVSSRATGPAKPATTVGVIADCGIDIMNKTSNKHVITKHTSMTKDVAVKTASSKPERRTVPKATRPDQSTTKSNTKSDKSSLKTANSTGFKKPTPNKFNRIDEPGKNKATTKNTVGQSDVTTRDKRRNISTDNGRSSKVLVKPKTSIKYNGPNAIAKHAGNANAAPKGDCIPTVSVNGESVASRTGRPLSGQATTPPRSASTESIRTVLSASFSKSNKSIITIISVPSSESSITKSSRQRQASVDSHDSTTSCSSRTNSSPRQRRVSVDSRDSTTSCSSRTTCSPRQRLGSVDSSDSTITCSSITTCSTRSNTATPCNQFRVEDVSSNSGLTSRSDSVMSRSSAIAVSPSQKGVLVVSHSSTGPSPCRKRVPSDSHSSIGASPPSQKRVPIVPYSSIVDQKKVSNVSRASVDASLSQKRVSNVSRASVDASLSQKRMSDVSRTSVAASLSQKRVTDVSRASVAASLSQKMVSNVASVDASPSQKRMSTVSRSLTNTSRSSSSASAMSGRRSGKQT